MCNIRKVAGKLNLPVISKLGIQFFCLQQYKCLLRMAFNPILTRSFDFVLTFVTYVQGVPKETYDLKRA